MKRLAILTALLLLIIPISTADAPEEITVQGRLSDKDKNYLEGAYDITFTIYDVSENAKWSEKQSVSVSDGFFNAI